MKKERNVWIQIFRICACLLVFTVHFGQRMSFDGKLRLFTDFGKYGVHLFFIISGFLVVNSLNKKEGILTFYKKRMISILPLYFIVILWYFITENLLNNYYHQIPVDTYGLGWFRYLFLLNGFITSTVYFWDNLGITWTIPIFAFFYLISPFLLKYIKKYWHSLIALMVTYILCYFIGKYYSCNIVNYIYYFFIGISLNFCYKEKKLSNFIVLFSIIFIAFSIIGNISYALLFAIIIAAVIDKKISLPNKVQKIVNVLDEYSFSIYLVHGIVFCSFIDHTDLFQIELSRPIIASIAIVGTAIGTFVVHRFIEKPIQNYLKKVLL